MQYQEASLFGKPMQSLLSLYILHAIMKWYSSSTWLRWQSLQNNSSRGIFLYRPDSVSNLWLDSTTPREFKHDSFIHRVTQVMFFLEWCFKLCICYKLRGGFFIYFAFKGRHVATRKLAFNSVHSSTHGECWLILPISGRNQVFQVMLLYASKSYSTLILCLLAVYCIKIDKMHHIIGAST